MRLGVVTGKNQAHSVDQCQLQVWQFLMPVFIDLLSIPLGGTGFTGIQKAVVDQMGSRPPNSDHDLFFLGASLTLGSALELLLGLVTELIIAGFHIKSISVTNQNLMEKWFIVV